MKAAQGRDDLRPDDAAEGVRVRAVDPEVQAFGAAISLSFLAPSGQERPYDTVGIQYGLNALNSGLIVPEQFVDLNEKIGGFDIDLNYQAARSEADPGAMVLP